MTVKEIKEGMTAPEVAEVIKENFEELNNEKATKEELTELGSKVGGGIILKQGNFSSRLVAYVNSGFFVETNDDFAVMNVINISIDGVREIIAPDDSERSSYFIDANGKYEITFRRKDNGGLTPNDDVIKSFIGGAVLSSETTISDIINVNRIVGSDDSFATTTSARQAVPTHLRKPNATLYYILNGKVRIERYLATAYDATGWVYGTWLVLSYANSMNISTENGIFDSKDSARKYNVSRSAGTLITYLLEDGWHTELLLENTTSSLDTYWKEVAFVPYVDEKIGEISTLFNKSINEFENKIGAISPKILLDTKGTQAINNVFVFDEQTTIDYVVCMEFSGNLPKGLRFYKNANYEKLIEDVEITSNYQVFELPSGAYSVNVFYEEADTSVSFSIKLTGNDIYSLIAMNKNSILQLNEDMAEMQEATEENKESIDKTNSVEEIRNILYTPKKYGAMEEIVLDEADLQYGYITADGEFATHGKRIVTKAIYVGGHNAINILHSGAWSGNSISIDVYVYKQKEDGSLVFSRKTEHEYLSSTQNQVAFLQEDETHVRFYCEFTDESWASVKVTFSQFLESIIVYCGKVTNEISNGGYIGIDKYIDMKNANVGWALGQFGFANNRLNYTTIKPIRVKEGVKYMFNAKSMGNIANVQFFTSSDGIEWTSGGWIKYNSGSPIYNVSYCIPKGHELCKIVVSFYTALDELYDLDKYEMRLWDTSLNQECFADKIIPLVKESSDKGIRYAQGIAIDNGYVFQAFATGEIDVYRLSDRKFIQTFAMPDQDETHRHIGVLAFVNGKYQEDDEFNLMILPADADGYKDLLIRWTMEGDTMSYEVVGDIPLIQGKTNYSRFGYDTKRNKLIVQYYNTFETSGDYASTMGYPTCEIYSVSEWNENAVYSLDKSFDLVDGYAYQSAMVNGDKIYEPVGVGLNAVSVFVINSFTEKVERIIDMTQFGLDVEEPQGMTLYDGKIFFSTVYGIYIINL